MLVQENEISSNLTDLLTGDLKDAYKKVKALINLIFQKQNVKDLKDEFEDGYYDCAKLLKMEGHRDEATFFMTICDSYLYVMDDPDTLFELKDFFRDYFAAFDELLYTKINNPVNYKAKYNEFLFYEGNMDDYFVLNYVTPSKHYNEEIHAKIINGIDRLMK